MSRLATPAGPATRAGPSGLQYLSARPSWPRLGPSRRGAPRRVAAQPSTQREAFTSSASSHEPSSSSAEEAGLQQKYDYDIWHYKPWWCQPPSIVAAGVLFIVASNVLTEPSVKTTVLAAGPVALWWYMFLYLLPRQFKEFAVDYIQHHPECQEEEGAAQTQEKQQQGRLRN